MKNKLTYKITLRGLLVAAAFVLSWVETQIPYPFPLPGMKLGLTNLVVLMALYKLSNIDALAINIVRIVLVGFTFGNMYSLYYSLAGGLMSFLIMYLLKRFTKLDIKYVSIAGGITHNMAQIALSMIIVNTVKIAWYIPFLLVSGTIAGIVIGLLCQLVTKRLPANLFLIFLLLAVTGISLTACGNNYSNTTHKDIFAMDTFMTIDASGKNSEKALEEASAEIQRLDELWSVGLHNSEIAQINEGKIHSISSDTQNVINKVIDLEPELEGSFDLTVYPLMDLWGFTSQNMKVPEANDIADCLSRVSMDNLLLDSGNLTLLNKAQIDLGAVAKGYASDRIVNILKENSVESANINLGGNVYVLGTKPDGSYWKIAVENPDSSLEALKNAPYIGVLSLQNKAIVTSGDYHRFFIEDNKKYHHIMDPSTGYPADSGLLSITVVSSDGTLADILSTALFIMGKEKALTYWKVHSDSIDIILVETDGSITITPGIKDSFRSDLSYSVYE